MSSVSVSRVINAPLDTVWRIFTDIPEGTSHMSELMAVEVLSDQPFGVGYRWRETRKMFGRTATEEMWVTASSEHESYEVRAESHGAVYASRFDFAAAAGGTRVDYTFSGEPVSAFARAMSLATGWMMTGTLRKQLEKDLADLAAACERA